MTLKTPPLAQSELFINPQVLFSKWEPENWSTAPDWQPVIHRFLQTTQALNLGAFLQNRLVAGAIIHPSQPLRALETTPLAQVKVVILGQDPYHGENQADGLAFSVSEGVATPPSLRNIYKEIAQDPALTRQTKPNLPKGLSPSSSLLPWALQGVLLLNTCLTVEHCQPASHSKQGWEALTDEVIKTLWAGNNPVVFMLWGAHAQSKQALMVPREADNLNQVAQTPHLVLTANHPSPLSALRQPTPFIGCGHFGKANAFLEMQGQKPIAW